MDSGILIIDKPAGLTSHDVVSRLRRILKTKKIGHTGTLDPFATGVLVMLVGSATRLAQFLDKDEKSYEALVRFGFETDTGDKTGNPKQEDAEKEKRGEVELNDLENKINEVLPEFTGEIEQIPPMYSAKKVKGKKLYEMARKGIEIEREPIKVNIGKLQVLDYGLPKNEYAGTQDIGLSVTCSAGTYIRTLAEDIGRRIDVPCHLAELRRTGAGKFKIANAVTLEKLEELQEAESTPEILVSMNEAISHLPKVKLDKKQTEQIKNGMRFDFTSEKFADEQVFRMCDEMENLIAVGIFDKTGEYIQPRIVIV